MAARRPSFPADGNQVVIGARWALIGLCDDAIPVISKGAAGRVDGNLDRLLVQGCLDAVGVFRYFIERGNTRDSLALVVETRRPLFRCLKCKGSPSPASCKNTCGSNSRSRRSHAYSRSLDSPRAPEAP